MQLTGKVEYIGATVAVSEKFKKREIVIVDASNSQYPQPIMLQLTQDKTALADKCSVGQEVTAEYNLRGRKFENGAGETKYFNTLEAWKITPSGDKPKETAPQHIPDNDLEDVPF